MGWLDRRRQARMSAVAPMVDDTPSGMSALPKKISIDPRQERARFYARRIGFIRNTYRFMAFQAARCPLRVEMSEDGVDWQPVDPIEDTWAYEAMRAIRPSRGSQEDLIRKGVFLDDTVGECYLIDRTDNADDPSFGVYDVSVVKKNRAGFVIQESPGGKPQDGTAFIVGDDRVYRHWQPDEEYDLVATSSLIGMIDDLDTYWNLLRVLRRQSNSRLAMNNILWTPTEAHTLTVMVNNQKISKLNYDMAQMASASLNDRDDNDVASSAPVGLNTPGSLHTPEILEIPSLGPDLLAYIKDTRELIADGLPLSTSAIFAAQSSANHWSDWLADDRDLQTISERLSRVLDSWTLAVFRPTLQAGKRMGVWNGNPALLRIGFDAEAIRRKLDNSSNAMWAYANMLIHDEAAREALHFKETDAPDDSQFEQMIAHRTAVTKATAAGAPGGSPAPPGGTPGASVGTANPAALNGNGSVAGELPASGPVPNNGEVPALTAGVRQPVLTVFDDRWLFAER